MWFWQSYYTPAECPRKSSSARSPTTSPTKYSSSNYRSPTKSSPPNYPSPTNCPSPTKTPSHTPSPTFPLSSHKFPSPVKNTLRQSSLKTVPILKRSARKSQQICEGLQTGSHYFILTKRFVAHSLPALSKRCS